MTNGSVYNKWVRQGWRLIKRSEEEEKWMNIIMIYGFIMIYYLFIYQVPTFKPSTSFII